MSLKAVIEPQIHYISKEYEKQKKENSFDFLKRIKGKLDQIENVCNLILGEEIISLNEINRAWLIKKIILNLQQITENDPYSEAKIRKYIWELIDYQ